VAGGECGAAFLVQDDANRLGRFAIDGKEAEVLSNVVFWR
jgi:hypothetical protein